MAFSGHLLLYLLHLAPFGFVVLLHKLTALLPLHTLLPPHTECVLLAKPLWTHGAIAPNKAVAPCFTPECPREQLSWVVCLCKGSTEG